MSLCALCRKNGEGRNFPWKSDNAFVKVSSIESNGAFSLIEGLKILILIFLLLFSLFSCCFCLFFSSF